MDDLDNAACSILERASRCLEVSFSLGWAGLGLLRRRPATHMTAVKPYSPARLFTSALESLEQEKRSVRSHPSDKPCNIAAARLRFLYCAWKTQLSIVPRLGLRRKPTYSPNTWTRSLRTDKYTRPCMRPSINSGKQGLRIPCLAGFSVRSTLLQWMAGHSC